MSYTPKYLLSSIQKAHRMKSSVFANRSRDTLTERIADCFYSEYKALEISEAWKKFFSFFLSFFSFCKKCIS